MTKTEVTQQHSEDEEVLYEGGEGDTCCIIFPLKLGVQILSVLCVIWGF